MTRREQLQDQYEDALFALLMDEVATSEGKKALEENERLKNDPDAAVPEDVSERCLRTIRRHFAKEKAKTAGRFTFKAFRNVALVAGICSILFLTAFAASEPLRVNTVNLVVQVFGESTDFHFSSKTQSSTYTVEAEWLPDGYVLEDRVEDNISTWCLFRKSVDESIQIKYSQGDGTLLSVDTENAQTENIQINGIQAMLTEKDAEIQIVWGIADNTAFIQLLGTGVEKNDLIYVAEQLKY